MVSVLASSAVDRGFEYNKGVTRSSKSKDRHYNDQKENDKQGLTKHYYTEN